MDQAPGKPGIPPRWTSSAKTGVGTARNGRVWFTTSHGILNEIYYPRIDRACTRDFGLLVSSENGLFLEEKRHATQQQHSLDHLAPGFVITNDLPGGHRIEKTVITDPTHDCLLQATRYTPGEGGTFHVTALVAPHLVNRGSDNVAWVGDYKGIPMLFAEGSGTVLAMAADVPWLARSVGFVGTSDGWQDVHRHGKMTWEYDRADGGNVALAGELAWQEHDGFFTIGLGFGASAAEAGYQVRSALAQKFETVQRRFVAGWSDDEPDAGDRLEAASIRVLEVHESAGFPGGFIASLSIPWGFSKGDDDIGGYHLVWARDLVETATGFLAAGRTGPAVRILEYLCATQELDGHWPQNMWLDGSPHWTGIQMDETALPILAVGLAARSGADIDVGAYWPMVQRAAAFIVANGPVSPEDRWEEDPGYSPFTVAAEISALLTASHIASAAQQHEAATLLCEVADAWNAQIERWLFVTDTDLAARVGVEGYYVRISSSDTEAPEDGWIPIKNRPPSQSSAPAAEVVSPDALALVRFGLRSPDDPRILSTVKVIDELLKVDLPQGPAWLRYDGDGYGEHDDGSPFDGIGVGRPWPLLTGERAHYELAAGNIDEARRLAGMLFASAGDSLLLPEQLWNGPDLPRHELRLGGPTGSAMPLCWAHAEYLRLKRSLRDGVVFDRPEDPFERYVRKGTPACSMVWSRKQKCRSMPMHTPLRIVVPEPFTIRWSVDDWSTSHDLKSSDPGLGVHTAELPTSRLRKGTIVSFTFRYADRWEGMNYAVAIDGPSGS
ncbi:glucoamylase precursor [bacterium BMS3Abin02]|nr:glucoamylase precursor [bacterium BMS3Abin02]